MVRILKDRPVTLLAEKVETTEQFRECLDLGFQLFQGYYFAHPSVLKKKRVDVSGTALLSLQVPVSGNQALQPIWMPLR